MSDWISVEARLPDEDMRVLVAYEGDVSTATVEKDADGLYLYLGCSNTGWYGPVDIEDVDCWMSLPELPNV